MNKLLSLRLRKCSDVNLDLPFFEILDDSGEIFMDISESDDGERSILFHQACVGKSIAIELINQLVKEAGTLIDKEKE